VAIIVHQPTEPSAFEISSIARNTVNGSSPTCCAAWRSIGRTKCGLPTSPTSHWPAAFSI
jgi:hypothetical protein